MKPFIRIGNAGGFWGDDLGALKRQLSGGKLDYISIDFLAEITMSILRKQKLKKNDAGYVNDFVNQMIENAHLIKQTGAKIITNAGGINPLGCARKIAAELKKLNISLKIAIVEGDDIVDFIGDFYPKHADFKNIETGEHFAPFKDKIQSANVYLGVLPIVKALESGADLIIAGRVTDTAITMGPAIFEFNWKINDWDKLASALVAGHIIECGAQSTGGNFTDWKLVERWDNMGYPIVEIYPDSSFVVTKHENTGGLVSVNTVKEQLVYEMGNPAQYISPDVVADFRTIQLELQSANRVRVWGIKGEPATPTYKVSMAYADGYKATSSIIICGDDAVAKAEKFTEIFWNRLNLDFEKTNSEMVGYNACHKELANDIAPNEILLRFHVYDSNQEKINEFGKQIAPLILSGPPGVAVTGGRPAPMEVMTYYPALIDKNLVKIKVSVLNSEGEITMCNEIDSVTGFERELNTHSKENNQDTTAFLFNNEMIEVPLRSICLARSGDKGDTSNVGVVARNEKAYHFLKKELSDERVKLFFGSLCKGEVKRYELDNLLALNFLLEQALDGGGTKSLMIDAQGKTFASALLNWKMNVPKELID